MAEYIKCRNCESPDCKGCNLKNLETMLNNGKFDCLMDGNRCVNPSADVAPVVHGRWIDKPTGRYRRWQAWCSECNERCGCGGTIESQHKKFCPNCGAKMDLEVPNGTE